MAKGTSKQVVITGATRGLGWEMTARFVEGGHTVIGCGSSSDLVAKLQDRFGKPHSFTQLDVSDDEQVRRWAETSLEQFGAPDLVLNNAGLINRNAPLWEVPVEEFSRVIDINIKGVANVIRHFLPAMIKRGSGVIVNFSSGWGRTTAPDVAPYCASKWGVEGLTQALAQELPPGLAAVAVNPGIINTEMLQSCFGDSAADHRDPETWSRTAVPFLLKLGPKDSGEQLTAPR